MKLGIFQVPTGARVEISTMTVTNQNTGVSFSAAYNATATNKIKFFHGAMRRLFIDADIEFAPGVREIWLSDDRDPETKKLKLGKGTYFKGSARDRLHGSQP